MKPVLRISALLVIAAVTLGADCCDINRHAHFVEAAKAVTTCRDRGGVPVLEKEPSCDTGGHCFALLARCDFPGQIKLQGEK